MANYLLTYHGGSKHETEEAEAASLQAWNDWMDAAGESLLDAGDSTGTSRTISADGSVSDTGSDPVTGYAIVEAEDIDEAIELARGCPIIAEGGSIEVAELVDFMEFDEDDEDEDEDEDEEDDEAAAKDD